MRLPNGYGGVVKLSGNRRRPYAARITTGWHINDITGKRIQHYQILGYAPTRSEALQILARYNNYPIDGETLKLTFREIYLRWSEEKFPTISHSNIKGYRAAYATCENIADMPFHNLRLNDLQQVIDHCGKNYPTLKKIRVLFNQLYSYAMKHEIVSKDYSAYVNISKYKDRNPNKNIRSCFSTSEIALLWKHKNDPYCQTVLMLIYNGVRVSELLDLKKENVHLSEQYFDQYKISYEKDTKEVCARVITITIQEPKDPSQGTESFALDVNKTEIDNLVDNDHNTPADYVITASVNQMINGVANQTLSRGTELKDNTTEVKSITYKLEDKDGKDVSANTGCDITMGRNTMTVQTVSFSAFTAEKNFGAGTYKITATVKTGKKTESDSTKWVTKTFTTTFTVKDTQPTGDMSLEKDSIDRVSDSEALVKAAVKLVYGDHTYGVDDENMSIVSVEGITNTGAKLDKDNTAISSSVKSVTIKKITFTVDSGDYKVDVTKDISSNPYVISFK